MQTNTPAARSLKRACELFRKDLDAIPAEAFTKSFGSATRTVADIVYEVNLVNDHVGLTIRGEPLFDWPEGWIKAPDGFASKEEILRAFDESSNRIVETAAGYSQAELDAPLQTDEGETTREERCRFMTVHLWYHLGQLNYIQTMLGDTDWHWF